MTEHALWLDSSSLLSKWGFNDGDVPDALLDRLDELDRPYPNNWHEVLRMLVRAHLVPALDQAVEVVEIETSHNPIRAERVNGVDVTDCWRSAEPAVNLTPEGVSVPYDDVLSALTSAPA